MAPRIQQAPVERTRPPVRAVHLTERARARFEEASNIQRSTKPHDIRGAIPQVDYTSPAKFPPYVFREYPKMPLSDGGKPIVIHDDGTVLVFFDAADEVDFRENNPELAEEIDRNAPGLTISAQLQKSDETISELRRMLQNAGIDPDVNKSKPHNSVSGAVRASDDDDSYASSFGDDEGDGDNPEEQGAESENTPEIKAAKPNASGGHKPAVKTGGLPATLRPKNGK